MKTSNLVQYFCVVNSVLAASHGHHLERQHIHAGHANKRLLVSSGDPVDVSGDHAFQAPQKGDQRGPCPGLNALANHGYIPRSGIVGILDVITTINSVYGMGLDLSAILAIMGTVWTGNVLSLNPSFSIGGEDSRVQNLLGNLLGLLGSPQGLNRSHNFIEVDSSPMRNDLYVTGDPVTMNLTLFESLYDMVPEGTNQTFDMNVVAAYSSKRFNESVATNPHFYYGPITGNIARNAGYFFFGRLFANHSSDHPEGVLTHEVLKSFFAVTGSRENFTYQFGHERIPENWYRKPVDYSLVEFNLDLVDVILQYPELASLGGNTGTVNSFTVLDVSDPLSGVLNVQNLLKSNNLLCLVLQVIKFAAPNYTNNIFSTVFNLVGPVLETVGIPLLNLSCPAAADLEAGGQDLLNEVESKYPGANDSNTITS